MEVIWSSTDVGATCLDSSSHSPSRRVRPFGSGSERDRKRLGKRPESAVTTSGSRSGPYRPHAVLIARIGPSEILPATDTSRPGATPRLPAALPASGPLRNLEASSAFRDALTFTRGTQCGPHWLTNFGQLCLCAKSIASNRSHTAGTVRFSTALSSSIRMSV